MQKKPKTAAAEADLKCCGDGIIQEYGGGIVRYLIVSNTNVKKKCLIYISCSLSALVLLFYSGLYCTVIQHRVT